MEYSRCKFIDTFRSSNTKGYKEIDEKYFLYFVPVGFSSVVDEERNTKIAIEHKVKGKQDNLYLKVPGKVFFFINLLCIGDVMVFVEVQFWTNLFRAKCY